MHVLLAPDRFGSLSRTSQVASASVSGWTAAAPHDTLDLCPMSDGGPGFVTQLGEVFGPRGRPMAPGVLLIENPEVGNTVYVDSAIGLAHGGGSTGVGAQLSAALACAPRRVVIGLGGPADGTAVPDAGVGLLAALGVTGCADRTDVDGLARLTGADLDGLDQVIDKWRSIDLVGAVASDITLLGLHGTSASAAQVGVLTSAHAQDLERALGHATHAIWSWTRENTAARVVRALPLADGQADARVRDLTGLPGAGAGAGIGWVLALLGGRLVPGAEFWADAIGLAHRVRQADLVVAIGEDLSSSTFPGSGVEQAAAAAAEVGVPCVVLAWTSIMNRREYAGSGISASYTVTDDGGAIMPERFAELAARVARSWSPRRMAPQSS